MLVDIISKKDFNCISNRAGLNQKYCEYQLENESKNRVRDGCPKSCNYCFEDQTSSSPSDRLLSNVIALIPQQI